jgi:hypothetical protein
LQNIVKNPKQFWRVQDAALATMPAMVSPRPGKQVHTLVLGQVDRAVELERFYIFEFQKRFGVPSQINVSRPNDFSNLLEYFLQRALVRSIACIRGSSNVVSNNVFGFLIELYKMNLNDDNRFDDGYYQGVLIMAIAQAASSRPRKEASKAECERYNKLLPMALSLLTHAANVDKLTPTFQQAVTHSAIKGIWLLQATKAIEWQPAFFRDHALYGHTLIVRKLAIDCLAKLSQRHPDALQFLLELGTVRVFRQKLYTRGCHWITRTSCSFEANMRVTNGIPLGWSLLSPVGTVNSVQTLKAKTTTPLTPPLTLTLTINSVQTLKAKTTTPLQFECMH